MISDLQPFTVASGPMAPKNKDSGKGKGKAKGNDNEGSAGVVGKLKPAQSIKVRHILVLSRIYKCACS